MVILRANAADLNLAASSDISSGPTGKVKLYAAVDLVAAGTITAGTGGADLDALDDVVVQAALTSSGVVDILATDDVTIAANVTAFNVAAVTGVMQVAGQDVAITAGTVNTKGTGPDRYGDGWHDRWRTVDQSRIFDHYGTGPCLPWAARQYRRRWCYTDRFQCEYDRRAVGHFRWECAGLPEDQWRRADSEGGYRSNGGGAGAGRIELRTMSGRVLLFTGADLTHGLGGILFSGCAGVTGG